MGFLSAVYFWSHEDSLREKLWVLYKAGFSLEKYEEMAGKSLLRVESSKSSFISDNEGGGLDRRKSMANVRKMSMSPSKGSSKILPTEGDAPTRTDSILEEKAINVASEKKSLLSQTSTGGGSTGVLQNTPSAWLESKADDVDATGTAAAGTEEANSSNAPVGAVEVFHVEEGIQV
jgi:hypothetical protein